MESGTEAKDRQTPQPDLKMPTSALRLCTLSSAHSSQGRLYPHTRGHGTQRLCGGQGVWAAWMLLVE